ncbi:MAG: MMPL family transporter [Dermatophilaceae bacterium]
MAPDISTLSTRVRPTLLRRLGLLVGRHARATVALWVVLSAVAFTAALGGFGNESLFSRLGSGDPSVASESVTGRDLLNDSDRVGPSVLVTVAGVSLDDPAVAAATKDFATKVTTNAPVASVTSPFVVPGGPRSPAAAPMLAHGSPTSGGFLVTATLNVGLDTPTRDAAIRTVEKQAADTLGAIPGATVHTGGVRQLVSAVVGQLQTDMKHGEALALPVSLLVLVLVFGGFIAAGMPIVGALASIGGGLASLLAFSHLIDLEATVVNVVTILGLGLCIDYGLLVVSRFREEVRHLAEGRPAHDLPREIFVEATARTVATAGRTVVFSAVTVAISLAGLLIFEATIMRAIGAAGVSVVVVALVVAVTLVPALCMLAGRRLLRKGTEIPPHEGVFSRLARAVQKAPWLVVGATVAVLVALALPALGMRVVSSGVQLLPTDATQRLFFEELARDYPATSQAPVTVVGRTTLGAAQQWARSAATLPGVKSVDPPVEVRGGYVQIGLRTGAAPAEDVNSALVASLRANRPPFETWVTGPTAVLGDFTSSLVARAPYAFALVALATIVLLFLMSGSIVLPLKALIFNVLSLAATLGVLTWVFQGGHLSGLLRFSPAGGVESVIPLLVLAFGFGLSMDYEVFLLSRIIELHEHGVGDADAVVYGLQRSGRIISSAAILVVIVFAGFAAGELLIIKETGFALAVAVAIDATLVRMLLVPATMTLFGRWNWWAPGPLRRLHDRFAIVE